MWESPSQAAGPKSPAHHSLVFASNVFPKGGSSTLNTHFCLIQHSILPWRICDKSKQTILCTIYLLL